MSDPSQLPSGITREQIEDYIQQKWQRIEEELRHAREAIREEIAASTENCVKVGDQVALKSCNGQLICAQNGGPDVPHKVFEFQSREEIGPHELFQVVK
jgi:hypothetical protein